MRILAGILMMVVGLFGGMVWIGTYVTPTELESNKWLLGLVSMVLPVVGGFFTLKARHWRLAMAGAIFNMLFFAFTVNILLFFTMGILIVLILIMRRGEFQ